VEEVVAVVSEKLMTEGVVTEEDLAGRLPNEERMRLRGFAVTECIQEIPCNPCVHACPFNAISMENINAPPVVDFEKCTGCAVCVRSCPGLAIFVIDVSKEETTVTMPYEFIPLPRVGEVVDGLDREGNVVCEAKVVRVLPGEKYDHTSTITVAVPRDLVMAVRHIRLRRSNRDDEGAEERVGT